MGVILGALDRPVEAVRLKEKILEVRSKKYGRRNAATLNAMNNLAIQLMRLGKLKEAEPLSLES